MRGASAGIAALALLLAACAGWKPYAADEPVSKHVTLHVKSYDPDTGEFRVELRNDSRRTIGYLDPFGTFDTHPVPKVEGWNDLPADLLMHARPLEPGRSAVKSSTCRPSGACARPGVHYGLHVCWMKNFDCDRLEVVWTDRPLNQLVTPQK